MKHDGLPVGKFEEIGGMNTYISLPPGNNSEYNKILLWFADVYSPTFLNNQLVMDWFASRGEC